MQSIIRTSIARTGAVRHARRVLRVALVATLVASFSVVVPSTASAAPSNYQLLIEQIASQPNITSLIDNKISSIYIGRCRVSGSAATAPVSVRLRGGGQFLGTMVLRKSSGRWYLFSITRGAQAGGISNVEVPAGLTSGIMRTAVSQQTNNQSFALGIIQGRFRLITVQSVARNVGTGTIRVRLSGGSARARNAQIVFLSKNAANAKKYWFLAAIR